jgi:hypothetical protein
LDIPHAMVTRTKVISANNDLFRFFIS